MCFFSSSGYRHFINPPPSLGNLLLDITLMFNFILLSFRFLLILVLGLGLGFWSVIGLGLGFGIGNLKHI